MSHTRSAEATIAGYLYQFDKTILEILNTQAENVFIEGIEDIDVEDLSELEKSEKSIQVKYYAGTSFDVSKIKQPIQLMFKQYMEDLKDKKIKRNYYFYGNFKDSTEKLKTEGFKLINQKDKNLLKFLREDILTNKDKDGNIKDEFFKNEEDIQYTPTVLRDFIEHLHIDINAKDINDQYKEVISLLNKEIDDCKSEQEAEEYYYNNALSVVFRKSTLVCSEAEELKSDIEEKKKEIIKLDEKLKTKKVKEDENKVNDIKENKDKCEKEKEKLIQELIDKNKQARKINKEEFISLINKKYVLFNKWYAWDRGKIKYLEYISCKLKNAKALSKTKDKFLYIGKEYLKSNEEEAFVDFVKNLIQDSFELNEALSKHKVWTLILDVEEGKIKEYCEKLNQKEIKFNDGNESWGNNNFNINKFNEEPIINTDKCGVITKASYQIKIISADAFNKNRDKIKNIDVIINFSSNCSEALGEGLDDTSIYVIEETKGIRSLSDINIIFNSHLNKNKYFRILTVSPSNIEIEVTDPNKFKNSNEKFTIGSYVKITDEFEESTIGILTNYKIKDVNDYNQEINTTKVSPSFILDIQPIGYLKDNEFHRGSNNISIPPNYVEIVDNELLKNIFKQKNLEQEFCFSSLPQALSNNNSSIDVVLNGDKFFNKHLAVVGSTGSGKSCTVAKILQEGIGPFGFKQKSNGILNNSHIIIFDLHGEYENAFSGKCRKLTAEEIKLPYWLMNAQELENFFLDVEGKDYNQKNIFKKAVTWNKKLHNKDSNNNVRDEINYDTPVYFNIKEVLQCIKNFNIAKQNSEGKIVFKDTNDTEICEEDENYINGNLFKELKEAIKAKDYSVTKAQSFNGQFTAFISRLETKINDDRLKFLLNKGQAYKCSLKDIIRQFIGYDYTSDNNKKNVVIVDLSGMPFEVINISVALISRLIFNFAFHWKKINKNDEIRVPFLLVYEEAHNYIPKSTEAKYSYVKESVERIAKEGRKYGVSAMIVSQRPSEISETIFSQCNSFVVMRLTNPSDQEYIKKLLPDDVSLLTDSLSSFKQKEALIIGEAIPMPAVVEIHEVDKDKLPKSNDVKFMQLWRKDWDPFNDFDDVVKSLEKND